MRRTLTVRVLSVNSPPPSATRSVKFALLAVQLATILAVTVPFVLTIPEAVTPFTVAVEPPLTKTVNAPAAVSASVTVAIVEVVTELP